jgi:hypothetical protein
MCKSKTLYHTIIREYHPSIANSTEVKSFMDTHWGWMNIEKMIEETMAAVGGYEFVDGEHHDFSDLTECKTGSIKINPQQNTNNCYSVRITNIESGAGITKGSIRAVIYNPHTDACMYYYIPASHLNTKIKLTFLNGPGTIKNIDATWNSNTNRINKLEQYRVTTFTELCTMTDEIFLETEMLKAA